MPDEDYNIAIGETYPAIKGIKSKFPRIMDLFLKSFSKKRLTAVKKPRKFMGFYYKLSILCLPYDNLKAPILVAAFFLAGVVWNR